MKAALCGCILSESYSVEQFLALAARHGCGGADLGLDQVLALDPADPVGAGRALFDQYGVYPSAWGLPEIFRGSEAAFADGLPDFARQVELAAALGAPRMCTWFMPVVPDAADFRRTVGARLRRMAQLAGEHGVRLGLEWVAPEHIRHEVAGEPFIWRMDQMLDWIEEMGEPNLGLLVDSFHCYCAQVTPADLAALPASMVVHVHINDAPDRTLSDQRDGERVYPGEGILDLAGFVGALQSLGYPDYLSTEVINPQLAQSVPDEEAVRRAVSPVLRLLEAAAL